jgi:hypothetical protein
VPLLARRSRNIGREHRIGQLELTIGALPNRDQKVVVVNIALVAGSTTRRAQALITAALGIEEITEYRKVVVIG